MFVVSALVGCGRVPVTGVEPPTHGALFGAYVDPPVYTEQGRIEAYENFESQVGRTLDIFHDFHKWRDAFPSHADRYFAARDVTVLLSWAGTRTSEILSGRDDWMIRERAEELVQFGHPVLLRWRWEMNRPNLRGEIGSPADYVAAWRHIHDIFQQVGADDVSWVWCPLASGTADRDFGAYYPGDEYVDWICVDVYPDGPSQSFAQVAEGFMSWAAGVDKPVLIGEFGRRRGERGDRSVWLREAQEYVSNTPQIKAVCYFESDRGTSGAYGVSGDPVALAAFKAWANAPYFVTR